MADTISEQEFGRSRRVGRLLFGALGPFIALLFVTALFYGADQLQDDGGKFASVRSAQNILVQSSIIGMAALGMTIIIIAGGIDLSAGTALALCATTLAWGLREDLAYLCRHGENFAGASSRLEAAQADLRGALTAHDDQRISQAREQERRLRERLLTIGQAKQASLQSAESSADEPLRERIAKRLRSLDDKIRRLEDPKFKLEVTPDWLDVPNAPGTTPLAVLLGICTGLATGLTNGLLVSKLRIVPFVVTLGTMGLYQGLAKLVGDNTSVRPLPSQIPNWIPQLLEPTPLESWMLFAPCVWLLMLLAALVAGMLRYTVFGRHVFAIGSSESTARLCGVRVQGVRLAVYTLAGLFIGIAGLFQFSRLSTGSPTSGAGKELLIIAAVVIGGGSLSGGRASILGTLTGAIMMLVISSGCTALRLPNPLQEIIVGVIIIAAVWIDQLRQRRLGTT